MARSSFRLVGRQGDRFLSFGPPHLRTRIRLGGVLWPQVPLAFVGIDGCDQRTVARLPGYTLSLPQREAIAGPNDSVPSVTAWRTTLRRGATM
jgi:hypothetical protein